MESWCAGLFGGVLMQGFIAMTLQHIISSRFYISRDLFFLLSFVMKLENEVRPATIDSFFPSLFPLLDLRPMGSLRQVQLPANSLREIESELLPSVSALVKHYHLLHWTALRYCPTEKYAFTPFH